jgi:hypothetical protein
VADNGAGIYNTDDRKRLPAEPHKLWKAGCSAMHAKHERVRCPGLIRSLTPQQAAGNALAICGSIPQLQTGIHVPYYGGKEKLCHADAGELAWPLLFPGCVA